MKSTGDLERWKTGPRWRERQKKSREFILALESPHDAAMVLGYVQAKLLLAAGAEHEAHARELLADSTQGVLACWASMKGNGWTQ